MIRQAWIRGNQVTCDSLWKHVHSGVEYRVVRIKKAHCGLFLIEICRASKVGGSAQRGVIELGCKEFIKRFKEIAKPPYAVDHKKMFGVGMTTEELCGRLEKGDVWFDNETECYAEIFELERIGTDYAVVYFHLSREGAPEKVRTNLPEFRKKWTFVRKGTSTNSAFTDNVDLDLSHTSSPQMKAFLIELNLMEGMVHPQWVRGRLDQILKSEVE